MKYYLTIFLLLTCCLLGISCYSYSLPYAGIITSVTVNSGLNTNTIYNIYRGKKNLFWFSTDMGLSRYDGFRVRNYPLISYRNSLTTSVVHAVRTICEDQDGLFYLQLLQGGIACFDQDREVYLPVRFEKAFDGNKITSLYINDNRIYIGTTDGLYTGTINRSANRAQDEITIDPSPVPIIKGSISHLSGEEGKSVFAVTDRSGVVMYNLTTKKVENLNRGNNGSKVVALYCSGDYLWICPEGTDLECYDLKRKVSRTVPDTGAFSPLRIGYSNVTSMVSLDNKTFQVATRNGILQLNFSSADLTGASCSIQYADYLYHNQMGKNITGLLYDNTQKILWISTFGSGVLRVNLWKDTYRRIEQPVDADVTGIQEDVKGYVWLATSDGKILRSTSDVLSANTTFIPWTRGLKADRRYRIYKDRQGKLWMADNRAGIVVVDPSSDDVSSLQLVPEGKTDFQVSVRHIYFDSRNRSWIATTGGLVLLNLKDKRCRQVDLDDKDRNVKEVYAIAEDKNGNMWLGTDYGLKRVELNGSKAQLSGNYERDAGYQVSPVTAIYVDSYNQILVTYADKVLRIDGRKENKVENAFTLLNGLSSGFIYCMVDDQNGNTWMGSNSGIMTIRNDGTSFYKYTSSGDHRAVCRLHDGRLLWADSFGLIFFDPLAAKTCSNNGKLIVTELWVNGKDVAVAEKVNGQTVLSASPDLQREFVFNAENNDFTFYFSDSWFGTMQRKLAYRLLPDEEWKIGALKNGISYKQLPVGKYKLQVKLVYPDASEGETVELVIRVTPHWWASAWACWGYIMLACGALAAVYWCMNRRTKKSEKRKIHERKLEESFDLYKTGQDRKHELETMYNRLLTTIVKELRTPLSLIIAPLKEMSKDTALPPVLLPKVNVAYRNSLGLLDACNQLQLIYTQTPLSEKLEVTPCPAGKITDEIAHSVSELVRINPIDFHYDKKNGEKPDLWVNKGQIQFVIRNLIVNAFNHIHLSGVVRLSVQETVKDDLRYCMVTVFDNGKNQVKEFRARPDEEAHIDLSSIELGYDLMEKIILLHHGRIGMKSDARTGTEVTVEIPAGKELFENDPNVIVADSVQEERSGELVSAGEKLPELVRKPEEGTLQRESGPVALVKNKKTLLIVEDKKDIRLYLKILFGKEYDLLMATNGQEGVDMAVREQPDLILCDVMMPVKDGFECCREIKEGLDTCHIPFIMLTARVEDDDIVHGLELGADDYILKPFIPGILKAKVKNLIEGRINLKQMYTKLLMTSENDEGSGQAKSLRDEKVDNPFVNKLVQIIEENICEADFNVKKLASEMNMSQPTLYRKVKQSTDFTIIELIRSVRMRKAAMLLKQKVYAVQEVSEMVGYNDIPTFRKHFVEAFDTTPSTYADSLEDL